MSLKAIFTFNILIILFSVLAKDVAAINYYVASDGSNSNNGTSLTTPFLTIQKASDVAIAGDIVNVRKGVYREMINLKANGVIYQTYNGEHVIINGTDLMVSWNLTSGDTYETTMNWDVDPMWGSNQLFCDGRMIELARWPDQTSSDIVMPTNAVADSVTTSGNYFTFIDATFNEPDGRWIGAQIWVNLSNHLNDGQGWTGFVTATNKAAHTITVDFKDVPRLGEQPWGLNSRTEYFLFNPSTKGVNATGGVNALLNNGEWWKNNNTLYVKTPNGLSPGANGEGSNVIEAKRRHFAFWASTTRSNYMIRNFILFGCSITTDVGATHNRVIIEEAHDIVIDGIIAKYVSHQTDMSGNWQEQHYNWSGIVLSGRNNIIRNSHIQYASTSALSVSGFGNKVFNNVIAHTNYLCSNAGAFNTGFICKDAEIAFNTIYNTSVMAINFRFSQNSDINVPDVYRIHHNTIYNFMLRSGDSGAIDEVAFDGQWIRIDHNLIYNTVPTSGSNMVHGIYLDFGGGAKVDQGHYTVDHNIIQDVPVPILINNIRDVNIYNNVLLSNTGDHAIVNANGDLHGIDDKVYNNIMSKEPNVVGRWGLDMSAADIKHNICNASDSVLNTLFLNPIKRDYHLLGTATAAIDKGISVGRYDENVNGIPDLGVFEYDDSIIIDPKTITGRWLILKLNKKSKKKLFTCLISDANEQKVIKNSFVSNGISQQIKVGKLVQGIYTVIVSDGTLTWTNKIEIAQK